MTIRYDGKVAIITGAGGGLGRSHAIEMAKRGAKVVVNDLGGSVNGEGQNSDAAMAVVAEIEALGGEAMAHPANVANADDVADMVEKVMAQWGRIDILVNNAGILRDKSFTKMDLADFRTVLEVHLMGTVNCTKAVWDIMKGQEYGRIVVTSSSSGLYGNFGQSNYGAAKHPKHNRATPEHTRHARVASATHRSTAWAPQVQPAAHACASQARSRALRAHRRPVPCSPIMMP